jgi:hypothetical protein
MPPAESNSEAVPVPKAISGGLAMRNFISIVCVLVISGLCHADEPAIVAADPAQGNRIAALRRAAEHLEAAGLPDEAARIRAIAAALPRGGDDQRQALLRSKLEQLVALQAEIAALRDAPAVLDERATGESRKVMLSIRMLEVDREKMHRSGIDWPSATAPVSQVLDADDALEETIEVWRRRQLVRELSSPRLVTVSGRRVFFRNGPTQEIEFEPHDRGNGWLHLRWGVRTPLHMNDAAAPPVGGQILEVKSAEDLAYSQSIVAHVRLRRHDPFDSRPDRKEPAIVLLITPTLVNPIDLAAPALDSEAAVRPRQYDLLDPPAVDGPQPAARRRATQR